MNLREFFALAPLVVFVFWIGLCPQHFTKPMEGVWQMTTQAAAEKLESPNKLALTQAAK
jgi:NADH:ubiquinone oxidoreductase subunit 4 (subunit M)